MKKIAIMAILAAAIMVIPLLTVAIQLQPAYAADPSAWYMTVPGNLNTDTYSLYPYGSNSLTFGFSQFGEMIDANTNTGLLYNGLDPFTNPAVPMFEWNEGWMINLTYSYGGLYRNVWAFALFSDDYSAASIGGNWVNAPSPDSTSVVGGRKYGGEMWNGTTFLPIGYVTTMPLTVLYNSPREFVALCNNTIWEDTSGTAPLVGVLLTFVFDKVNKDVIVIKDVKLLDQRKFAGTMQVEFGDRGEWDLGTTARPQSTAYIWLNQSNAYDMTDGQVWQPFYNATAGHPADFDVAQIISSSTPGYLGFEAFWPTPTSAFVEGTPYIDRSTQLLSTLSTKQVNFIADGDDTQFQIPSTVPQPVQYAQGAGVWSSAPMVFVNGAIKALNTDYTWNAITNTVTFYNPPASGSAIWIIYKSKDIQQNMSAEPSTPYIIGEWTFDLSLANTKASTNQFRGITVYGRTDVHTATYSPTGGVLDSEAKYQLNQIFWPSDLNQAVDQSTNRYVEFSTNPIGSTTYTTIQRPVIAVSTPSWSCYNVQSERVIDLTTGKVLNRTNLDYGFTMNEVTGYGTFTGLNSAHYYKFLYSTYPEYSNSIDPVEVNTQTDNISGTSGAIGFNWASYLSNENSLQWTDPTGVSHALSADDLSFSIANTTNLTDNYTWTYTSPTIEWDHSPFVVNKEDAVLGDGFWTESGTYGFPTTPVSAQTVDDDPVVAPLNITLNSVELNWNIWFNPAGSNFTDLKDIMFYQFCQDFSIQIDVSYNVTTTSFTTSATIVWGSQNEEDEPTGYAYWMPGSYQTGVVGTNAATVDSAGLGNVVAAFKDKEVEYGLSTGDIMTANVPNQMPFVMSQITAGNTWSAYYYNASSDFRTALGDDWCTTYPISSSNMIGVGGPLANLLAYYGNDFTTAFYGLSQFTSYAPWQNAIVPLSCWNAPQQAKQYVDTNTTGYAVISTFQDLNGTTVFLIWGNWGRDTYYATWYFYNWEAMELQCAPRGVTSIVMKINYVSTTAGYKPVSFSIPEVLGTFSETAWKYSALGKTISKGGIHPDP